ncbi:MULTISPECIES: mismatch-specific DNA-glycosylase [Asticcacaulis]|uniref:mismatch-specific DNA-glycosylase n=1 Tax=Asticcacaulis TaxID=76890 RepID=UPI001AE80BAF|nr:MULTISPECIES: mismatch-specific DNA-glycosylase [Asticcacaulis]MBP2159469.1 TDG/mug DNA glycosylase family protein [Asticcacaulis solisilvae]MDR6800704.1 TDG/mug DNA glycosylase family protein [Asticcacaulis sp. BE141]
MPETRLDKFGPLPAEHCVPDLLSAGLKVVFCGTALGRVSAERRAYYANPGNFFWRTLHNIGLTPERVRPEDYATLLQFGIGLTDLCKAHFGNDNELPAGALDAGALRNKILKFQPRILAFTSKTGAGTFLGRPTGAIPLGFQDDKVGETRICVLPSPSGQARIFWDQQAWQDLADAVKAMP